MSSSWAYVRAVSPDGRFHCYRCDDATAAQYLMDALRHAGWREIEQY